jgi:DNA-binding CsgD family transcriptional regulator
LTEAAKSSVVTFWHQGAGMRSDQHLSNGGGNTDQPESFCVRFPIVACVGPSVMLAGLPRRFAAKLVSGSPRPLQGPDVIILDSGLESSLADWVGANPETPLLVMQDRLLKEMSLGSRFALPAEAEVKDLTRFVAGVALAASQMVRPRMPAYKRRLLTPRELEVLYEFARGLRIKGVAGTLNISENTVKQHLMNARHKLGAPDRVTAVLSAIRHGLIPFPTRPFE